MCTMLFFYSLMCRNYQEYKRKPCWTRIRTFLKSAWELFIEIISLTPDDDVKWKSNVIHSCGKFYFHNPELNIWPNPSPDAPDMPVFVSPKTGWRKSESQYKGRNPRSWKPPRTTNFPPPRQPSWGGEPAQHHPHHQGWSWPRRAAAAATTGLQPPPRAAAAAWYVSNVYIISCVSCYIISYYYMFYMHYLGLTY